MKHVYVLSVLPRRVYEQKSVAKAGRTSEERTDRARLFLASGYCLSYVWF